MNPSLQIIPITQLAMTLLPVAVVIFFLWRWSLDAPNALYAIARMLVQLLVIGYFLSYLFSAESAMLVLLVMAVMVMVASWIALRTVPARRPRLYVRALVSILIAGGLTLALVTQGVLQLSPWFWPRYMIPLAGMIFANALNSVSLAAERFYAETHRGTPYRQARSIALGASLIPITNALFAVGLVSLPGMMTGQILSGISPLIAVRYQIMVMCMLYGAAGMASVLFLSALRPSTVN
jgi:putative ABC transport system permease protein